MKVLGSPDAFGNVIFCDDVRVENTGKFMYIGVYPGHMHVHGTFPFAIPKLSIGISYYQRPTKFVTPIKFWIFLPGDPDDKPSIEAELPEEATKEAIAGALKLASSNLEPNNAFATIHSNFSFSNLTIQQPGLLKVRAVRGDELIRLGTVLIEAAVPQAAPTSPPQ